MAAAFGIVIVVVVDVATIRPSTIAAWAQDSQSVNPFHVSWELRASGIPMIQGRIHNNSPYRVTNVRLHVEGFAADDRRVGHTLAWALGDIAPRGETTFVVERVPGAVTYRGVAIQSFDVVSQAP